MLQGVQLKGINRLKTFFPKNYYDIRIQQYILHKDTKCAQYIRFLKNIFRNICIFSISRFENQTSKIRRGHNFVKIVKSFQSLLENFMLYLTKKKSFFIRIMQASTLALLPWQNSMMPHPPFSPDLVIASCQIGKKISSNDKSISEGSAYFEGLEHAYFLQRIQQFIKRRTK